MAQKELPIHVVINKDIYQKLAVRKTEYKMKGITRSFADIISEALDK